MIKTRIQYIPFEIFLGEIYTRLKLNEIIKCRQLSKDMESIANEDILEFTKRRLKLLSFEKFSFRAAKTLAIYGTMLINKTPTLKSYMGDGPIGFVVDLCRIHEDEILSDFNDMKENQIIIVEQEIYCTEDDFYENDLILYHIAIRFTPEKNNKKYLSLIFNDTDENRRTFYRLLNNNLNMTGIWCDKNIARKNKRLK